MIFEESDISAASFPKNRSGCNQMYARGTKSRPRNDESETTELRGSAVTLGFPDPIRGNPRPFADFKKMPRAPCFAC